MRVVASLLCRWHIPGQVTEIANVSTLPQVQGTPGLPQPPWHHSPGALGVCLEMLTNSFIIRQAQSYAFNLC